MFKKILRTKSSWAPKVRKSEARENSEILEMCSKCYSFSYDNGWHIERPRFLGESSAEDKVFVKFSQCPACVEEALAMYDMEYA